MDERLFAVDVFYALAGEQDVVRVVVPAGATVRDALDRSGFLQRHPGFDLEAAPLGIFAERVHLDAVVREGDRIEIYRPLVADPKESRRRRAGLRKR